MNSPGYFKAMKIPVKFMAMNTLVLDILDHVNFKVINSPGYFKE